MSAVPRFVLGLAVLAAAARFLLRLPAPLGSVLLALGCVGVVEWSARADEVRR